RLRHRRRPTGGNRRGVPGHPRWTHHRPDPRREGRRFFRRRDQRGPARRTAAHTPGRSAVTGTDDTPVRPSRRTLLSGLAGLGGLAGGGLIGHKVTEERTRAREEELTGLIEPARRSATHKDGLPPALSLPTPAHIHVLALDVTGEDASDRKSTRLNSSHVSISYAVFCLK